MCISQGCASRGFICAQVAAFDELVDYGGDLQLLARDKKVRQQGKKYLVNDGDIVSFDYYTAAQLEEHHRAAASTGSGK